MTLEQITKGASVFMAPHLLCCGPKYLLAAAKAVPSLGISVPFLLSTTSGIDQMMHSGIHYLTSGLECLGLSPSSAETISHGGIEYGLPAMALVSILANTYSALGSQPLTTLGLGPIAPDDPLNMVTSYVGEQK